jgi:hypothetical protein
MNRIIMSSNRTPTMMKLSKQRMPAYRRHSLSSFCKAYEIALSSQRFAIAMRHRLRRERHEDKSHLFE